MFYKILFSIMLSTLLYGGEIVWSSGASQSVSDAENNEAIREYVAQKYPKELKAWENRGKEIESKSVTLGKLMWQDDESVKTVRKDWEDAMAHCKSLELFGFNDWRLPTKDELESIADMSRKPSIKKEFKNVSSSYYWSSTTNEDFKYLAGLVNFYGGVVRNSFKYYSYYVRCVRAGE